MEVSDSTSASIGTDFVWLANLACTWEHVQAMCDISDSYTSSPAVQFRNKLLHAVLDLQNALGMTDLGLLHPVPYKDGHGAIVFVIIQYVKDVSGGGAGEGERLGAAGRWAGLQSCREVGGGGLQSCREVGGASELQGGGRGSGAAGSGRGSGAAGRWEGLRSCREWEGLQSCREVGGAPELQGGGRGSRAAGRWEGLRSCREVGGAPELQGGGRGSRAAGRWEGLQSCREVGGAPELQGGGRGSRAAGRWEGLQSCREVGRGSRAAGRAPVQYVYLKVTFGTIHFILYCREVVLFQN